MLQLPKMLMRYQRGYDEAHKEIVIRNPLHKGFNQSQFYAKKSTKSNQLELVGLFILRVVFKMKPKRVRTI